MLLEENTEYVLSMVHEVHDDSIVLSEKDLFEEAILIAFEVASDKFPSTEDFTYNGKEIHKLSHSIGDNRTRIGLPREKIDKYIIQAEETKR